MALTAKQISDLNNSMVANQNVGMGDLISEAGDDIDALEVYSTLLARMIADAVIVVGAEVPNTINVAVQLNDAAGDALATSSSLFAYLSDDADGSSITATAPDGNIVIGTDGLLIPVVADKAFQLVSEADGSIDLDIVDSGTPTFYLVVVLPNGDLVISDAITFA